VHRAVLNYSEFYLTLGPTPDTDWETLRANCKRLIGRWHPARFSADAVRKENAEERSKPITLASDPTGISRNSWEFRMQCHFYT